MAQISKKSETELRKELKQHKADLQRFRFGMTGSKTRNVKRGRDIRKDIARILTELRAREQAK